MMVQAKITKAFKNGGSDDDFKSDNRAMYRGMFAVLTLVCSMPR
jgi:hypothetical protein